MRPTRALVCVHSARISKDRLLIDRRSIHEALLYFSQDGIFSCLAGQRMPFESIGKSLILIGALVALIGVIVLISGRIPGLGKLPGDIVWQRDNVSIYIPIVTSIVISVVLTLVLNVIARLFWR